MVRLGRCWHLIAFLVIAMAPALAAQDTAAVPAEAPQTWQELREFQAGPTPYDTLMAFWTELARARPEVTIQPVARTLMGREVVLVVISSEPVHSPEDALRSGKAIVLIANSVHGAETAGKEASQIVARDLLYGELRHVLDDVVVLFIPVLNPDGGELRRRTNEAGLDLNRDYIKLESQEIRGLVTRVLRVWTPDIHVDTHHGGASPYTLTWQGSLNPAVDAELRDFPYRHIFPRIRAALRAEDYEGFDYAGPQVVDWVPGWGTTSLEPRKHHTYAGLINSIAILLESPSGIRRLRNHGTILDPVPAEERYRHQVRGQVIAQRTILEVAAEMRQEIRELTNGARRRAAAVSPEAPPIVLEYRTTSRGRDMVWVPDAMSVLGYRPDVRDIFLRREPTRTVPRPIGYVMPPAMTGVVPLLQAHGIAVYQFAEPVTLDLEIYHAVQVNQGDYIEGHYIRSVIVERSEAEVAVPAGAYYVPMAQPRGNLIGYLMEPETDENLITWGYADHILRVTPPSLADGNPLQRFQRQLVPMMRLVQEQPLPVTLVPAD